MHEMMMMYEIGKLRMHELIGDTERRMLEYQGTPKSEHFARRIIRNLTGKQYAARM